MTEEDRKSLNYHSKIKVYRKEMNFGPGTAQLMQLVEQTGSLSAACKEMKMAYSKGWKIVKQAEEDLGFALMKGRRGGERGGHTVLTEDGKEFLNRYLQFADQAEAVLDQLFEQFFF